MVFLNEDSFDSLSQEQVHCICRSMANIRPSLLLHKLTLMPSDEELIEKNCERQLAVMDDGLLTLD
jgi:hypothetical protein